MRGRQLRLIQAFGLAALLLILTSASLVIAQSTATCPPRALLSIARAGSACVNLEAGKTCYGSGSVASISNEGSTTPGLTQLGDRVSLRDLRSISVTPTEPEADAPVSIAALAIRTSPQAIGVFNVLLLVDAELRSEVIPPVELVMQATGSLHVRVAPANDAAIIAELGVNSSVMANGRHDAWLRVIVPATGETGWVSASLLRAQGNGDTRSLPEAEPGDAVTQPFQIVHLRGSASTACDGILPAGALVQTPSTDLKDAVAVTLNNVTLRLAGTAFLTQHADMLKLIVLDGIAEVGAGSAAQYIPAGAQRTIALDAEGNATGTLSSAAPYDAALTAALPINSLPRRFQVTAPQPQAVIDARLVSLTAPTPTPVVIEPTPINACRRTLGRRTTIWSGPGENYEALTALEAGTAITPVLATTNPSGAVWWQLANSGWVARTDVVERGDCTGQPIPVAGRIAAPPTNTYSLERCESFNGPVRSGQRVTFEFTPPAWDNLGEARAAVQTDPGHFTLNSRRYFANASAPFRLGENVNPLEDRYLRRFTLLWTAEPGTYRITGDWLSYEPSCNLTVPVE